MEDRRISYSSGNFSSIDRVEPGDPDRFADEDSARPETWAPEAVQAQAKSGKVKPIRRPASKDAKSKAGAGLLGRAGRRHARIRDVENLGTASAAATELSPGRAVAQTRAQEPAGSPDLSGDGPSPAIANRNDSQGGDGRTPAKPAAAEPDAAAANVTAALDVVEAADAPAGSEPAPVIADRAGGPAETGFGFTMSEDAVPPEVADLDDASGGGLDLAEFVIQAAVFGDDDGAIRIPWTPENATAKGKRAASDLADRPQEPDRRADRASGSGVTMPASAAGSADNDARDGKSASLSESRLAARRDVDNEIGARAADPVDPAPVAGNAADHRYVGPDLRIPIIDEDDIPPVRAAYEYEAAEPTDAESDAAVRSGEEATDEDTALSPVVAQPAIRAADSLERLREPDVEPPTLAETVNRAALRVAQGGPDDTGANPADGDLSAGQALVPDTSARAAAPIPAADAAGTVRDGSYERRAEDAAGRKRPGREQGLAGGSSRHHSVRVGRRLATRSGSFDADRRANILCGLAIAAAVGSAAWYFSVAGPTEPVKIVDADKPGAASPQGGGKPVSNRPSQTAADSRTAPIYRPAQKIRLASLTAVGDLEYRITPSTIDRVVRAARGDTFSAMLLSAGVNPEETATAVRALRSVYDPRGLQIGLELKVIFETPGVGKPRFLGYRFDSSADRMVHVARHTTGVYTARKVEKIVTQVYKRADGQIETSLFGAGIKAGAPPQIILQMLRLFSFAVDFQRDLHGGEKFHIMYRSHKDESGRIVKHGDIVFASLTVGGRTQKLYLNERPKGGAEYLNERGQGNRRALMKTPIDGARLTSRFGYRKHPLLGFTKLHSGVDFGARPGTPIYAAGNGTIVKIGWFGAYGRYVRIRHGSVFETAYAHMSRFRRGLRVGSRVKQGETIGYVGRSGRSTGPHLHYEVLRNGRRVNPIKLALPSGRRLKGRELKRFLAHRKEVDARYAALGKAKERQRDGAVQTVRSDGGAGCKNGVRIDLKDTRPCN